MIFIRTWLAWLLLSLLSNADAQAIALNDTLHDVSAMPYLDVLRDPERNLGIKQVVTLPFTPNPPNQVDFGYEPVAWWLRLTITSKDSCEWYVLIDFPQIAQADAFQVSTTTANIHPLGSMRSAENHQPMIRLPASSEPYHLYIRASNLGRERLYLPIRLLTDSALHAANKTDYLVIGSVYSILAVLALYNLLLFLKLRTPSYFWLTSLLILLFFLANRINNAFPPLSFLSDPGFFFHASSFQLVNIVAVETWRHLLDSRHQFPHADRLVGWLQRSGLLLAPFVGLLPASGIWVSLFTVLALLVTFVLTLQARCRVSRIVLVLVLIIGVTCTPYLLWQFGLVKQFASEALLLAEIGILISAILLSLIVAENTLQLRTQAQQAEARSRAKGEFLATMSHELRTPMNALSSAGRLLQTTPLNPQQHDYVDKLNTASRHMLNVINDVLDLARLENPQHVLEQQPFTLGELLANLDKLLQEHAQQKNLALNLQSWFPSGTTLQGDATRLSQVLLNLLNNALKFTEQGQVELLIREFLQADPHKSLLHFEVVDTGVGLSQQQQERLFEPFSPVAHNTDKRYRGTGLGLSISNKLVAAMGGKLAVESTPGEGSRFFFTLEFPLQTNAPVGACPASDFPDFPEESPAGLAPTTNPTGKHILLVDDDPLNLFFGQELLQMLGATVTTAASGTDAIHQLQQQTFDLVFMDVSMPGMDGYATTRRIRDLPHVASLPIIALTAHAIAGERERCLAAGMDDYLTKPFELEQLRSKVCQWTADAYNPPSPTQDRHKEPR